MGTGCAGPRQFDLACCRHFGLVQRVRELSAQAQVTMFWPAIGRSGLGTIRHGLSSVHPQTRHLPDSSFRKVATDILRPPNSRPTPTERVVPLKTHKHRFQIVLPRAEFGNALTMILGRFLKESKQFRVVLSVAYLGKPRFYLRTLLCIEVR